MTQQIPSKTTSTRRLEQRLLKLRRRQMFFEPLEDRRLLALLNVFLERPTISAEDLANNALTYNAATDLMQAHAVPYRFQETDAPSSVRCVGVSQGAPPNQANCADGVTPRNLQINILVDSSGNVTTAPGDDLVITGDIDSNTNGTIDPGEPSGTLLTGEIINFGFQDSGTATDFYDYRFLPTGGVLASYFADKHIGVVIESEDSTFTGSFNSDFQGAVKATVGPIRKDVKFHDLNANGVRDTGEPGLANWPIKIFIDSNQNNSLDPDPVDEDWTQSLTPSGFVMTEPGGYYSFAPPPDFLYGPDEDNYFVCEVAQGPPGSGWLQSAPSNTICASRGDASLAPGGFFVTGEAPTEPLDFGNFRLATKTGVKFLDRGTIGVRDDIVTDPPIAGWEIHLFGTDGGGDPVHMVDNTDANGVYSFDVNPGIYTVCEILDPSPFPGFTQSFPVPGPGIVSCAGHTDGGTVTPGPLGYSITLTSGQTDSGNDFGNKPADIPPPGIDIEKYVDDCVCPDDIDDCDFGDDADLPPGPSFPIGSTVTFTYVVTNPGQVELHNVVVTDDNETPDDPGDDFNPAPILNGGFNVGDTDMDNKLDPGEKWLYTHSELVTAGSGGGGGDLLPVTTSEMEKYLLIGTSSNGISKAVNVQNGELGADAVVLSTEINDNVDFDLKDVFAQPHCFNVQCQWIDTDPANLPGQPDFLPGAAAVHQGISWTGDVALTSPDGKFDMSNVELYGQVGVVADSGGPVSSVSNSYFFPNGVGGDAANPVGGQNLPPNGVTPNADSAMADLRAELDAFENFVTNLAPEATLTGGGGFPDFLGIENEAIFTLNIDVFDTNNDGLAVIDILIDNGNSDFKLTNSNWIIEGDGSTFAIFRIRGGSNLVLNQSTIVLGDGGIGNGGTALGAIFVKAAEFSNGQGGFNAGESLASSDTVFSFNDTVLNGVAFYDLIVFDEGNSDAHFDNGTTELKINDGQGCAQFISPKINFNDVRFERCAVPAGDNQHKNIGAVTATVTADPTSQSVTDSDPAHWVAEGTCGECFEITMGGNSATDGTDGNTRTFSSGDVSVEASAFSREKSNGAWSPAFLGAYGGGLGVTDSSEGSGANNSHTVDNLDLRDNYVVFEFSEAVVVDRVHFGYVVADSDIRVWIGNATNLVLDSDSDLSSLGFTEVNLTSSADPRWADINAGGVAGNILVIAALPEDDSPEDAFKIDIIDFCIPCPPCECEEPEPGIEMKKFTNDHDADTEATAPNIVPGATVTWTYKVTNTGNVPFTPAQIVIVDDNGTPGDPDDDLSTTDGDITYLSGDDGDNILEPGEIWTYKATGTALNLTTPGDPATFDLSGNDGSGAAGNIRTFTSGSVSVKASAFSRTKDTGVWSTAFLGSFSGGLGVTDGSENGADNTHTVDNVGRDNYVLFEFSESVVVDSAFLGYVVNDSDITVWIGTKTDPFNNHQTLSDAFLTSLGFTEVNLTDLTGTRTADLNAGQFAGNVLVIAAYTADTTPEDHFKIKKVKINQPESGCYENKGTVIVPGDTDSDLSHYCNPDTPPPMPGIDIEKTTNGPTNSNTTAPDYDNEDSSNGPGVPILTPGSSVTWTYKVTNTGNVPFTAAQVVVKDTNGTPTIPGDDFTPTRVLASDVGSDGILSPAEVWTYTASGTVQNVMGTGGASATFDFSGSDATDGPDGNIKTFTAGSVSVKASAFSRTKDTGAWSTAYLGRYGGGLGVTDSSEGSGSDNSHTVDNVGRDNYVLFEFNQSVIIDWAHLGYVVNDSDLKIWIGTKTDPFNNHGTLSDAYLTSLGFTEVNLTDLTGPRTAELNAGNMSGNVLVIAADPGDTTPDDKFKIELLKVKQSVPGIYENKATATVPDDSDSDLSHYKNPLPSQQVCVDSTYSFTGSSSTDGTDGNTRTFTLSGVGTVTVRAYSREKAAATWASAYVGAYSGGLGVTDSSEGTGANDTHTVDNIGRHNYLVFHFPTAVIIDRAFLGYVVADSDLTFWVGDSDGTPNSDSQLAAMLKGDDFTDSADPRWANINNGGVAGNTLVISGWLDDDTPDDRFKVQKLELCKPASGTLAAKDTASTGFWKSTYSYKGVALIKKLNGSATAKNLGNWLAGNFPNLFSGLANKDNTYISTYMGNTTTPLAVVDQQILGAALAAYVTSSELAGGTWATTYGGFNVSAGGSGGKTFNVGNNGTAIGLANHTAYSIIQLLQQANARKPFDTAESTAFNTIFSGINLNGNIALTAAGSLAVAEDSDRPLVTDLQPMDTGEFVVAVDVLSGDQAADMQASIADTIDLLNAALGAYGVTLVGSYGGDVENAAIHLNVADTTELGGVEEGVLGLSKAGGHITIVSGWNYYLGADVAAVGGDQYDFRTVVAHEILHAVGLGHSAEADSVMYTYLATAEARRALTTADFALLGAETGEESGEPEALLARPKAEAAAAIQPVIVQAAATLTGSNTSLLAATFTTLGIGSRATSGAGLFPSNIDRSHLPTPHAANIAATVRDGGPPTADSHDLFFSRLGTKRLRAASAEASWEGSYVESDSNNVGTLDAWFNQLGKLSQADDGAAVQRSEADSGHRPSITHRNNVSESNERLHRLTLNESALAANASASQENVQQTDRPHQEEPAAESETANRATEE